MFLIANAGVTALRAVRCAPPLGENQPVAEAPSQEFAPALRLDEVVAVRVEHVQERAVAGGDDEAVFHPCAEVDEAFVGDVA